MRFLTVLSSFAVFFLASGAFALSLEGSPEFQAHLDTVGEQRSPALAIDAAGNAMIAWTGGAGSIRGRVFGPSGAPRTGELEIANVGTSFQAEAKVMAIPDGGFLAVWRQGPGMAARRFDAFGQPLGAVFPLTASGGTPVIAPRPEGGLFLAWTELGSIRGAVLDSSFQAGPVLSLYPGTVSSSPALAAAPGGGFVLTWAMNQGALFTNDVWVQLFDSKGQPRADAFRVNDVAPYHAGYQAAPAVVFHANGSFSVFWQTVLVNGIGIPGLFGRTFDGAGKPLSGVVQLSSTGSLYAPALASDPFGRIFVVWGGASPEDSEDLFGLLLGPSLQPLSDPFRVNLFQGESQFEPAVAAHPHGGFTAVWTSGSGYPNILPTGLEGLSSQDGNFYGVFGRRFGGCIPGAGQLCLGSGRFRAEVAWTDHDGNTGTGKARALTDDTGAFSFFGESNLELMVKVLDGRGVNGSFWVFYGALSNVAYTLTVTDTATNITRTYTNPSGRMASRADVEAFSDPGPPPPAAAKAAVALPLTPPLFCSAGATELCLGDRFAVSVRFVDPRTGAPGQAQAIPLTPDTGAFWFFGQENFELMVKALDGRAVNNRYWIFYGALSDVEYTITVRDILTDETRTYRNPAGTMASRGDTSAFPLD